MTRPETPSSAARPTPSTSASRTATVIALALAACWLPGCANRKPVAKGPQATAPAPRVSTASSYEGTAVEPTVPAELPEAVVELLPEQMEPEDLSTATLDADRVDDPVSASPLDELAETEPELTHEELAEEREKLEEATPEFDIPVPLNESVLAWVDRYSVNLKTWFEGTLGRSTLYMPMFRQIFADAGLPQDLVYMAAVESGYKTNAYSRAHARGVFQFISSTARRYGLRVDYWVDERSDPEKSARAAAAYMKDLYAEFGDWHLALAAYNAGEGSVRRAIERSGVKNFWDLARTRHLRLETRNHVPAILAAAILSKHPAKYGLSYTAQEELRYDTIPVEGAADLRVLARCAGTEVETLKALNPALRRWQTPPDGTMDVRVPYGSGSLTLASLAEIPASERILYERYVVARGDTLSVIAAKHGVSVRAIQDANQMGRKTLIRTSQVLRIPTGAAGRYADLPEPADAGEVVTYRVRRGDTLYGIARRYGTTPAAIAQTNKLQVSDVLIAGRHLRIMRGVNGSSAGTAVAQAKSRTTTKPVIHTVRSGETLWQIARRYATSVEALCSWNAISPATVIRPGIKLKVGYR